MFYVNAINVNDIISEVTITKGVKFTYIYIVHLYSTSYEISTDKLRKREHVVITHIHVPVHVLILNLSNVLK